MKRDDVMKTIQGAEVCPGNAGVIKVPLSDFRHVAEGLRNDPQSPMDFLRDIVGMDWGEEGLGAIYFMESTVTGDTIAIRTATTDRQQPLLPTVSDLWKTALIKEREVYDFFGILFTGHPDMRRLFLREDWIGWPLRKDYDMKSNPLRLDNEINADITKEYRLQRDGTLQGIDHRVFGEDDFVFTAGNVQFVCVNTNALEFDYSQAVPDLSFLGDCLENTPDGVTKTVVAMHAGPYSEQFNCH